MHNPLTMGLRAIVLLVCLVGVPLIAVFGKNAPEMIKALIRNYASAANDTGSNSQFTSDAAPFRPGLVSSRATSEPPDRQATQASAESAATIEGNVSRPLVPVAEATQPGTIGRSATEAAQARNTLPRQDPFRRDPVVQAADGADRQRSGNVAPAAHLDSSRDQAPGSARAITHDMGGPRRNVAARFPPDHFRAAEQRLRQLGATYYLLETTGTEGNHYRFFCKVASPQNPEQPLAFFATGADPLTAMEDVIRQVEAWRAHLRQ
jgi:hypothetical protein